MTDAEDFRADATGAPRTGFMGTTLEKRTPRTNRKNTGDTCHGRLVIRAVKSAELHRRGKGAWYGIVLSADPANRNNVRFSRNHSPMV